MRIAVVKEIRDNWFAVYFTSTGTVDALHCETDQLVRLKPAIQLAEALAPERVYVRWAGDSRMLADSLQPALALMFT